MRKHCSRGCSRQPCGRRKELAHRRARPLPTVFFTPWGEGWGEGQGRVRALGVPQETIGRTVGASTGPSPQPSPHRKERWGEGARVHGTHVPRGAVMRSGCRLKQVDDPHRQVECGNGSQRVEQAEPQPRHDVKHHGGQQKRLNQDASDHAEERLRGEHQGHPGAVEFATACPAGMKRSKKFGTPGHAAQERCGADHQVDGASFGMRDTLPPGRRCTFGQIAAGSIRIFSPRSIARYPNHLRFGNSAIASSASTPPVIARGANLALPAKSAPVIMI